MLGFDLASLTFKPQDGTISHARFHFDYLASRFLILCQPVHLDKIAGVINFFLTTVEELLKCAFACNRQVCSVSLFTFDDRFFVDVLFDLFNQFNLLAASVECNCEWVVRTEEDLEHLMVSAELVTLDSVWA